VILVVNECVFTYVCTRVGLLETLACKSMYGIIIIIIIIIIIDLYSPVRS